MIIQLNSTVPPIEDLILREVYRDSKEYYDNENFLYIIHFPMINRAKVEYCGNDFWVDADGVHDAKFQVLHQRMIEREWAE